jgi:hypothetical protein
VQRPATPIATSLHPGQRGARACSATAPAAATLRESTPARIGMRWRAGDETAEVQVDVAARTFELTVTSDGELHEVTDPLDLPR